MDKKQQHPAWLNNFIDVYQRLGTDNLNLLDTIYHQAVFFKDPIHEVKGLNALQSYFSGLYTNLSQCDFHINDVIYDQGQAAIYWSMTFTHHKLNRAKPVHVTGSSHLRAKLDESHQEKVIYHRDYLDVGEMLYEQIPVFGHLVRLIKSKASRHG